MQLHPLPPILCLQQTICSSNPKMAQLFMSMLHKAFTLFWVMYNLHLSIYPQNIFLHIGVWMMLCIHCYKNHNSLQLGVSCHPLHKTKLYVQIIISCHMLQKTKLSTNRCLTIIFLTLGVNNMTINNLVIWNFSFTSLFKDESWLTHKHIKP